MLPELCVRMRPYVCVCVGLSVGGVRVGGVERWNRSRRMQIRLALTVPKTKDVDLTFPLRCIRGLVFLPMSYDLSCICGHHPSKPTRLSVSCQSYHAGISTCECMARRAGRICTRGEETPVNMDERSTIPSPFQSL